MNIIVAGASRGIGAALVNKFYLEGNRVLALSRNKEKLDELAASFTGGPGKGTVATRVFDAGDEHAADQLLPFIREEWGEIDILVYNAGYLVNKAFREISPSALERSFSVNVKGAFFLVQKLLDLFASPSHVLTISSMGGFQGSAKFSGLSAYSASKGALAVLTECLAEELKPRNISCNCLALGSVQTEMLAEAFPGYTAPLSPEEAATFIGDFAMNGFRFFNGKILPVSLSTP